MTATPEAPDADRSWISDSSTQVIYGSVDDRPHMVAPWVLASIHATSSALVEIDRVMQRLVIELTRSGVTIAEPEVEQHLADAARLFERANDTFTRPFLTCDPDPGSSAGR